MGLAAEISRHYDPNAETQPFLDPIESFGGITETQVDSDIFLLMFGEGKSFPLAPTTRPIASAVHAASLPKRVREEAPGEQAPPPPPPPKRHIMEDSKIEARLATIRGFGDIGFVA